MRITVSQALLLAGVKDPKAIIGKSEIFVGGVPAKGLDHVINYQDAKEITVTIDKKETVIKVPTETAPTKKTK